MTEEAQPIPARVPPPSLSAALMAGDLAGLGVLLESLDLERATLELTVLRDLFSHAQVDVARAAVRTACRLRMLPLMPLLRGVLTDTEALLAPDVLAALEGWCMPELVHSYRELLEIPDLPWKAQVLKNLSHHASADAAKLLAAWANRPEPELALPALIGLRRYPSMAYYRLAREAISNVSTDVAVEAARTMVAVGGKSALRELLRIGLTASREVQIETLELAQRAGESGLGSDLEAWLLHPDDSIVAMALGCMRALKTSAPPASLSRCLQGSDVQVRAEAVRTSVFLAPRDAADLMERGLADNHPEVQLAAVEGLASIATPRALDLLRRAISSASPSTRLGALRAFFLVKADEARAMARQLLTDKASEVRREALRLLGASGDVPEPESLRELLHDPDLAVREEARRFGPIPGADPDEAAQLAASGYAAQAATLLVGDIVDHGKDPRPLFQLGILLYGRGTHEAALEKFLQVLELEPNHQGALRYVAWVHEQLGDRDAQLGAVRRLSELAPGEVWAHRLLGLDAAAHGRHDEACERLGRVLASEPEDVEAAVRAGESHLAMGALEPARKCLERGTADPAHARRCHRLLAEVARRQDRLAASEEHLRDVLAGVPASDPEAACDLARLLVIRGKSAEAVRTLQPLTKLDSVPVAVWLIGADAALRLDRATDALAWAERCPVSEETDRERRFLRGEALRRLGRLIEAQPHLEAAAIPPVHRADVHAALARCRDSLGAPAAALESLARYYEAGGAPEPGIRLEEACYLRRAGRPSDALLVLDTLALVLEIATPVHHESALCHLALGAATQAARSARLFLEGAPGSVDGALLLAEATLMAGDLEAARRSLQDLVPVPSIGGRARRLLVTTLHRLGEPDRVIELAQTILDLHRDDAAFCAELGTAHYLKGQLGFAREWLARAVRQGPQEPAVIVRLAETELSGNNARGALEHVTPLSERWPDEPVYQRLRGLALIGVDRAAEAIPYLQRASSRLPDDSRLRSALTVALSRLRDDQSAVAIWPDVASLEAADEAAAIAFASSLDRLGRRKQALDALEHLAMDRRLGSSGLAIFASLCVADGDVVRAEGLLNTALKESPDDLVLLESRGELMMTRGRLRAAEQDFQRVLSRDGDRARALKLLGDAKLRLGAAQEGATLLSRYTRLNPSDPSGHRLLGQACLALTEPERAEKHFRSALDLNGQDPETAADLVLLLAATDRPDEASTLLTEFALGRVERIEALCRRAEKLVADGRRDLARWLQRELAVLGATVQSALLPLVLGLVREGMDREAWSIILEFGARSTDVLPVLGGELMGAGRPELARDVYRRSFELNGRNVSDLMGVARCQLALGERARARELFAEVRNRCPDHTEAGYRLAKLLAEEGQRVEASGAILEVLTREPDHVPSLELKIELDLVAGDTSAATVTVNSCLARDFGRADFHLLKAAVCRVKGQRAEAEDALLWAAGLDPSNERASCEAANVLAERGDLNGARDVLARLLSVQPRSRQGRVLLARLSPGKGDLEGVLREWHEIEKLRRLDDEETESFVEVLWAAGEEEEAARRVNRLRLEHPYSGLAWTLSSRLARRQGNSEAAIEFLSEAVRRLPGLVAAQSGLAECLEEMGRVTEALIHAKEAVRLEPGSRRHRFRLARILSVLGCDAEAIAEARELIAVDGEMRQDARLLSARSSIALDDRRTALELLVAEERPTAEVLELLADLSFEDHSWERAADVYGRLGVARGGLDLERQRRLVESFAQVGRLADAVRAMGELLKSMGEEQKEAELVCRFLVDLAGRLTTAHRDREAVELLNQGLICLTRLSNSGKVDLLLALARAEQQGGRTTEAERALGRAIRVGPEEDRALDAMAALHAANQTFERLRDVMQAVLRTRPESAAAELYLGAALSRLGKPRAGQEACGRAVRLKPSSPACHLGLARAARQGGDREAAAMAYARALELDPGNSQALTELVDMNVLGGEAAEPVAARVVSIAATLGAAGKSREAVQLLERVMRALPTLSTEGRVGLLLAIARAERDGGRNGEAERAIEQAIRIRPGDERSLDAIAALYTAAQRFERLRDLMLAVTRADPECVAAYLYLGAAQCRLGQAEFGQEACATAVRLAPSSPRCRLALGRAARQAGNTESAVSAYLWVLEMEPGHPAALMELGDVYESAGLRSLALKHSRRMLAASGGDMRVESKAHDLLSRAVA